MNKKSARIRRATYVRAKFKSIGAIRLVVFRTSRHIYAQIISADASKVLTAASTVEKNIAKNIIYTGNKDAAAVIGRIIAERSLEKGIKIVCFDRSGFKYHGRIQTLADAARKAGLQF